MKKYYIIIVTSIMTLVLMFILSYRMHWQAKPLLFNDSYQYLTVAGHARAGLIGYTSIVHFDAERSFGVIPAPLVTFPLGFSLMVAALSTLGLSLTVSAVLINGVALIAILWVVSASCAALRLHPFIVCAALALLAVNASFAQFATYVLSEALFAFLVTAGVVLVAMPPGRERVVTRTRAALAGLLIGLAYHVRYAGLFVCVGLLAMMLFSLAAGRRRSASNYLVATMVAAPLMIVGMVRNYMLVGNWRGGNEKIVSHSIGEVAYKSINVVDYLILGENSSRLLTFMHQIFFLLLLVCGGLLWFNFIKIKKKGYCADIYCKNIAIEISIIIIIYCACMFYAGITTVITYGPRMFFPLLPIIIISLACFSQSINSTIKNFNLKSRVLLSFLGIMILSFYVILNIHSTINHKVDDRTEFVRRMFFDHVDGHPSVYDILYKYISKDTVIIANDGQIVGYVLQAPVVSMVSKKFSGFEWNEDMLWCTAAQYKAGAVVIMIPEVAQMANPIRVPSDFVKDLMKLHHPSWLRPLFQSSRLILYRIEPGGRRP